jgi:hypothetical protein
VPAAPVFIPLRDFWSRYFEMTSRASPPLRESVALQRYLEAVFGELTHHAFDSLEVLPTRITCADCRNNTPERRDAVCETHLGVLTGIFQAMSHVPMEATRALDPDGQCVVTMNLATVGGVPVTAFATRLDHVELFHGAGQTMLFDRRAGMTYQLVPTAAAVMALLDRSQSSADLAAVTGLTDTAVRTILDQFYTAGWVSCRFDTAA